MGEVSGFFRACGFGFLKSIGKVPMICANADVWNRVLDSPLLEFIPFLLFLVVIIGLPIWLVARYAHRDRELLHRERMKALESGQPVDFGGSSKADEKNAHNIFWIAFWVGAVVPLGAVWGAVAATQMAAQHGYVIVVWVATAVIGTAAVISACVLMIRTRKTE
jgi:hypothetical protein